MKAMTYYWLHVMRPLGKKVTTLEQMRGGWGYKKTGEPEPQVSSAHDQLLLCSVTYEIIDM